MSHRQGPRERSFRYVLALTLVGMIPLAIWSGGCETGPVVEPPGDGGPTDVVTDRGDATSDSGIGTDADAGAPFQCCSPAESNQTRCSADGTALERCNDYFAPGPACVTSPQSGGYGYVWLVSKCPTGCAPGGSGTAARCQ